MAGFFNHYKHHWQYSSYSIITAYVVNLGGNPLHIFSEIFITIVHYKSAPIALASLLYCFSAIISHTLLTKTIFSKKLITTILVLLHSRNNTFFLVVNLMTRQDAQNIPLFVFIN